MPGLAAGAALATGRALGEFGATLMFAGSFQGVTQTAPLAIYDRFATDFDAALALSAVLVAVCGRDPAVREAGGRRGGARACSTLRRGTRLGALELDVSLDVAAGECLALAGPSGAGKTSILRVVAGLLRPERGVVRCGGETWLDTGTRARSGPGPAALRLPLPGPRALPAPERLANVAYPLRELPRGERRTRRSTLLGPLRDGARWPMPGRARSRAASASAWRWPGRWPAGPTCCCSTSRCRRSTRAPARAPAASSAPCCGRREVPALLVTHDFSEAALLGDRVGVIDGGRVVQEGSAGRAGGGPRHVVRGRLHRRGGAHRQRDPRPGRASRASSSTAAARSMSTDRGSRRRGGQRLPLGDRGRARRTGPIPAARRRTASRPRSHRSRSSATVCAGSGGRAAARGRGHAGLHAPAGAARGIARGSPPGRRPPRGSWPARPLGRAEPAQRAVEHVGALPLEEVAGALHHERARRARGRPPPSAAGSRAGSRGPRARRGSAWGWGSPPSGAIRSGDRARAAARTRSWRSRRGSARRRRTARS